MATAAVSTVIDPQDLQAGLKHALKSDGISLGPTSLESMLEEVIPKLENRGNEFNEIVDKAIRKYAPGINAKRHGAYFHAIGKALNSRRNRLKREEFEEEAWQAIREEERGREAEEEHRLTLQLFGLDIFLDPDNPEIEIDVFD